MAKKAQGDWERWNDRALAVAADAEEIRGRGGDKAARAKRMLEDMEHASDKLCLTKYVSEADRASIERGEALRDDLLGIPRTRTNEEREGAAA